MAGNHPVPFTIACSTLSTLLDSGHPPSSNQSFLFPLPLASSRSSLVVLVFSCHFATQEDQKHLLRLREVMVVEAPQNEEISGGKNNSWFSYP